MTTVQAEATKVTSTSTIDRLRHAIESADTKALADLYTREAVFDVNVPSWHFTRRGPGAIVAQWKEWFDEEGTPRSVVWRETPAEFGSVVEVEQRHDEKVSRWINVIFIDEGQITRQVLYCCGWWDAETLERNRREEPDAEWQ